jgi:hypothetical protein
VVRKVQNPLEEFFEVERSASDDQARPTTANSGEVSIDPQISTTVLTSHFLIILN